MLFSHYHQMSLVFSEPSVNFTPTVQLSPTFPMSSLDKQLAQAMAAITMLSNSMVAMQQQVAILIQNIAKQQQRMLPPIAPVPLSPLNIPLPCLHHPLLVVPAHICKGSMCSLPLSGRRNQKLQLLFISPANMMKPSHS